ncbi:RidA family protein [Ferrovibrio terrae]|uniref:RidA family protein n=1 Tax=Ferrovibrio terrae TaxID=2594003 RepID=UPI003137E5F3
MKRELLDPKTIAAPVGQYAHGCLVSEGTRILFISGQIGAAPDGSVPPDFESQARNVWRNIEAVLAEAGMSFDNLVKTTSFLTDHSQLIPNRKIRNEILGDRKCASSGIVTQTLVSDWLLEIEAIAMA